MPQRASFLVLILLMAVTLAVESVNMHEINIYSHSGNLIAQLPSGKSLLFAPQAIKSFRKGCRLAIPQSCFVFQDLQALSLWVQNYR